MRQVLHILRKDARHLRWLLVIWAAVLILDVLLAAVGANTANDTFTAAILFREISGLLPVLQTLILALMIARLIQSEPLVGWNAFWLTRPYARGALMTAKLLFLAGALVIAPLLVDLATMALVHAGPRAQVAAAPAFLFDHLWWALVLSAVAVLTPSLARFVLAVIGVFVGLAVTLLLMLSVVVALGVEPTTVMSPALSDPTPEVMSLILAITAALCVVVYQYRYRRWRVAAVMAAAGVVVTTFVPGWWPWAFLRPTAPDPGSWSRNVQATPVTIDPRMAMQATTRDAFEPNAPRIRQIHAQVNLTGMPADTSVQSVTARGTLTLPDGTTMTSLRNEGIPGPGDLEPDSPARAALGVEKILNDVQERHRTWPALLAIDEQEYQQYKGRSGRFNATLDFHLYRTRVRGTLPLRAGAALDEGLSRVEVLGATPEPGGYKLLVRQWQVHPLTAAGEYRQYQFMLRNRRERTAVELGSGGSWSGYFAGTTLGSRALSVAMPSGFSIGSGPQAFSTSTDILRFPVRMGIGFVGLAELPPSWFDDAELVVFDTTYAGTVTRSVSLADFVIPEE